MQSDLREALSSASVGELLEQGALGVLGLRWSSAGELDYSTLDEAVASGEFEISEVSDAGQVPTLLARNWSRRMVFLMAGEVLLGAKQNRAVNASLMVPAESKVKIPVSCVERGRWHPVSDLFSSGGTTSHARLREQVHRQVSNSLESTGMASSDQSAVWDEVDRKLDSTGSFSCTDSLLDAFEEVAPALESARSELTAPEGCNGVAFVIGGQIAGIDLFDKPSTLQKLWPKLVRAYAIDAWEQPKGTKPTVGRAEVETCLRSIREAEVKEYDSPGMGRDLRFKAAGLTGAALTVTDCPVHVELFAEPAGKAG